MVSITLTSGAVAAHSTYFGRLIIGASKPRSPNWTLTSSKSIEPSIIASYISDTSIASSSCMGAYPNCFKAAEKDVLPVRPRPTNASWGDGSVMGSRVHI